MTRARNNQFLEDQLRLLVSHFGHEKVRFALARVVPSEPAEQPVARRRVDRFASHGETVDVALASIKQADPSRYDALQSFAQRLRRREILLEPQDIRHFCQEAGIKGLQGRSRRELVPALLRSMLGLPTERLLPLIARAADISETSRRQGFSILTDRLLKDG
ncbi:MAG: hypothetical protein ABSF35_17595 [Polyangia bacterium]|jgi:hypothetical protein